MPPAQTATHLVTQREAFLATLMLGLRAAVGSAQSGPTCPFPLRTPLNSTAATALGTASSPFSLGRVECRT